MERDFDTLNDSQILISFEVLIDETDIVVYDKNGILFMESISTDDSIGFSYSQIIELPNEVLNFDFEDIKIPIDFECAKKMGINYLYINRFSDDLIEFVFSNKPHIYK